MFGRRKNRLQDIGLITLVLVGGAVAGAAAALMLTPKTGKDMRKQLRKGFDKWTEKATEEAVHIGEEIKGAVSKINAA